MMLSPLYLRDLAPNHREMMEDSVRKYRPDLVKSMDNGEDITVGGFYKPEDFEIS